MQRTETLTKPDPLPKALRSTMVLPRVAAVFMLVWLQGCSSPSHLFSVQATKHMWAEFEDMQDFLG